MGELATDPTRRFSSRVDNYIKYRPGYPSAVIDTLASECGLTEQLIVADVGSGTGILSELFLKHGNPVFGVEPNREMREAGERRLKQYPNFTSVNGTAEATTLPDRSMDFITAGQAFHWFDRIQTRKEFTRILKGGGWVALIWNDRHIDTSPFLCAYEDLLRQYGIDYARSCCTVTAPIARHSPIETWTRQPLRRSSLRRSPCSGRSITVRSSILAACKGGCYHLPTRPSRTTRITCPCSMPCAPFSTNIKSTVGWNSYTQRWCTSGIFADVN